MLTQHCEKSVERLGLERQVASNNDTRVDRSTVSNQPPLQTPVVIGGQEMKTRCKSVAETGRGVAYRDRRDAAITVPLVEIFEHCVDVGDKGLGGRGTKQGCSTGVCVSAWKEVLARATCACLGDVRLSSERAHQGNGARGKGVPPGHGVAHACLIIHLARQKERSMGNPPLLGASERRARYRSTRW